MSEMPDTFGGPDMLRGKAVALPDHGCIASPRILEGDRIVRHGIVYECRGKFGSGRKFVRLDTAAEVTIPNVQILREMEARELVLAAPAWLSKAQQEMWSVGFESRSSLEKHLASMRHDYVKALEENERQGYSQKTSEVIDKIHRRRMSETKNVEFGEVRPSQSAVYKWWQLWKKAEGAKSLKLLCCAESRRGPRGPHFDDAVAPLVRDAMRELWFTAQRHKVRTVWDRIVTKAHSQGIPPERIPCERTIRRAIKALPPYAVARERFGQRAADHQFRSVGQMAEAEFAGQIYEVDAHKLDFTAVDEANWPIGRLWLTAIIDRYSRAIVGFHIHVEPPSSLTIAAALRNAFLPKSYMRQRWPEIEWDWPCWGLPGLLVLDNALENKATFLMEAFHELGVPWAFSEPRTPEEKPYIERFWKTLASDFSRRLPGATGANIVEKGDYDAMGMACISLQQADELLHRWVSIYNNTDHQGIQLQPLVCWSNSVQELEVTPIADFALVDVLLGDFAIRTISRKGIYLLGLRYGDKLDYRPLEMLRTRAGAVGLKKVRIRFDRSDLSQIHVQDPVSKEYLHVPSLDSGYTRGLTLARHRIIRQRAVETAAGHSVSIGDLCRARDSLQRRIDELAGGEPMTERRFAAVFNGIGSKGSFADFYRLSQAEYGKSSHDGRSIIDLLETDEGWVLPDKDAPMSPESPERGTAKERKAYAGRTKSPAVREPPPVVAADPEQGVNLRKSEAALPDKPGEDDLAARASKLGMQLE